MAAVVEDTAVHGVAAQSSVQKLAGGNGDTADLRHLHLLHLVGVLKLGALPLQHHQALGQKHESQWRIMPGQCRREDKRHADAELLACMHMTASLMTVAQAIGW